MRSTSARVRALALAAVWILPGVWCTSHALAHELNAGAIAHDAELGGHHERMTSLADECLTGVSEDHHHGHDHPETAPALAPDGSKKIDAPTPVAAITASACSRAGPRSAGRSAAVGTQTYLLGAAFGPRAPPIS